MLVGQMRETTDGNLVHINKTLRFATMPDPGNGPSSGKGDRVILGDKASLRNNEMPDIDRQEVQAIKVSGIDVNKRERGGATPLIRAIERRDIKKVKILLAAGADPNKLGPVSNPPLYYAIYNDVPYNDYEMTKLLLSHGADPGALRDKKTGDTLLMYAVRIPKISVVEVINLLLAAGANVNARDRSGATALMRAVLKDRQDLVEALLGKGADPNFSITFRGNNYSTSGWTPLMSAAKAGDAPIVRCLLTASAKKETTNNHGKTAWDYATENFRKLVPELNPAPIG